MKEGRVGQAPDGTALCMLAVGVLAAWLAFPCPAPPLPSPWLNPGQHGLPQALESALLEHSAVGQCVTRGLQMVVVTTLSSTSPRATAQHPPARDAILATGPQSHESF